MSKSLTWSLIFIFTISQAFSWDTKVYEATIPFYSGERSLGDLKVEISGDSLISVEKESLIKSLSTVLKDDTVAALKKLPSRIDPTTLPFPMRLNPQDFKIETTLSLEMRGKEDIKLREDVREINQDALEPSPFGGAINYRLEQNWGDERLGGKTFTGQFNSFANFKSVVLENQSYYSTTDRQQWNRGDTRLVKDFQKNEIRTQAGDIYPQIQGFMQGRAVGGLSVQRNFSLNPYRLPFPTGTQNFTLKARSMVKYFVNGTLVKTEFLPAGNYTAKDIPLNNGLNTITIEATDDLGQRQIFVFKSATNISLLNRGESRFDLTYGTPFFDNNLQREYRESDGKLFSGFYQYGLTSEFSASLYDQNQLDFNLLGSEIIYATALGNFNLGHAQSNNGKQNGQGNSITYQYISQGQKWYQAHSLLMRYENRSDGFTTSSLETSSVVKNNYGINYTLPLANFMTFSAGLNYGDVRDNNLLDRRGFDTTVNFRLLDHHNISLFVSRIKDEYGEWNDTAFLFLTFSLPEKNAFVSNLYDQQQKSIRSTYLKDNRNRLYESRAQGTLENAQSQQLGEVDVLVPTPIGEIGGRAQAVNPRGENPAYARGSLRVNSALVFAYNNGIWGGGISRPVPGSFVIFKPEKQLKGQKVGLKSTSPYTESESGLFNEIVFSNLLAYQYRDIQLDPTMMREGYSLIKEKFTLYPTYRSAHLIPLEERGAVMLYGRLIDAKGSPLALQVGHVGEKAFFTNRKGHFFVEGLEPGNYILSIEGLEEKSSIKLNKNERGRKDIGTIQLKEEP